MAPLPSFDERFWPKVAPEPNTGCWLWLGKSNDGGYGMFWSGGSPYPHRPNRGRWLMAHRVSYEHHKGAIPEGLLVMHECDTPACVNPDHLSAGTQLDNMGDASARGRMKGPSLKGVRNPRARLTEKQVWQILTLHAQGGRTYKDLGVQFGVSVPTIGHIIRREHWRHVKWP